MTFVDLETSVHGSIIVVELGYSIEKKGDEEECIYNVQDIDNSNDHIFQRAEDCTVLLYRPPDLSLKQLHEFRIHISVFKKGESFYAISVDAVNIIGKGKSIITSIYHLLFMVKKAIRCGYGGIYPLPSTEAFQKLFFEKFTASFIDYHLIHYEDIEKKHIGDDVQTIRFDKEILSAIMIRKLMKKQLEDGKEVFITYKNYLQWVGDNCPTRICKNEFGIVLYNKKVNSENLILLKHKAMKYKKEMTVLKGINIKQFGTLEKIKDMC